jgi:hypothetical protein
MSVITTPQWFPQTSLYLIFLGLSSHIYLGRGEWDLAIWKHIITFVLLQPIIFMTLVILQHGILKSAVLLLILNLSYLLPLFFSIALYRLFFHPLKNVPGPFWARLSMFWKMKRLTEEDQYTLVDAMHKEYGDVVRMGRDGPR